MKNTGANPGPSVSNRLVVRNRQRAQRINSRLLRKIVRALLVDLLQIRSCDLALYVIGPSEMTRLNETFLRHRGSTDVLAFDYSEPPRLAAVRGEIFICADEAKIQAARYHTTWQSELVRYLVHGVLHLRGYDDQHPVTRRQMKRMENRLLGLLEKTFRFSNLG